MKMIKRILCFAIVLSTLVAMVLLPVPASAAESESNMKVVGASIRTEGTQGLRFVGKIKKSAYSLTTGNSANFGLILIPKYMVNSGTEITKSTSGVLTIKAVKAMEYNHPWIVSNVAAGERAAGYIYFVATVTGIAEENYKTDFLARVYVNTSYSTQDSRSVYTVANTLGLTSIVNTANSYGTDMVVPVTSIN